MEEDKKIKKRKVAFTPEQMEIIQSMLSSVKENSEGVSKISMYNTRDITKIETVNVSRFDGKFVVGFKNHQNDPLKKNKKWTVLKEDKARGLLREPFITLLLQEDENSKVEEHELALVDFLDLRSKFQAKVIEVVKKDVVEDFGILGSSGEFAVSINEKGVPEQRPMVKAEIKREVRVFHVELPGFSKPVEFISDFLT